MSGINNPKFETEKDIEELERYIKEGAHDRPAAECYSEEAINNIIKFLNDDDENSI